MVLAQRALMQWSLQVRDCSTGAVSVDRCDVKGLWSNQMPACSLDLGSDIQRTVTVCLVLALLLTLNWPSELRVLSPPTHPPPRKLDIVLCNVGVPFGEEEFNIEA